MTAKARDAVIDRSNGFLLAANVRYAGRNRSIEMMWLVTGMGRILPESR
jgi:hypothetical protein